MANNSTITIVGNIARDPEIRFTPSGQAVCEIGVAVNDRKKEGDDWVDDVSFIDCTIWGQQAQNVSESCEKGTRVLIRGRIKQDSWEDKTSGEKRSKIKVVVDDIGVEMRFATAEVVKNERSETSTSNRPATQQQGPAYDEADV